MKMVLGVIIGGVIGFTIGYLGKCTSGACPLTSNPLITAIIFALFGAMIAMGK